MSAFLIIFAAWLVALARIEIVYRVNMKAIDAIGARNKALLHSGQYEKATWSDFNPMSSMVLHLHKWTFKQFYPHLVPA